MTSARLTLNVSLFFCLAVACSSGGGMEDHLSPGNPDGTAPTGAIADAGAGSVALSPDSATGAGGAASTPSGGGAAGDGGVMAGAGSVGGMGGAVMGAAGGAAGMGGSGTAPMPPAVGYGGECRTNGMCRSGICLSDGDVCSRACDIDLPNPCRVEQAFCMPIDNDGFACGGQIDTGRDEDDAIVKVGDSVRRSVSRLDDQDLFTVKLDRLGVVVLSVQPSQGVDVALDAYNAIGEKIGTFNTGGLGSIESAQTEVESIDGWVLAAVRNVGTTTGTYEFKVERRAP